MCAKTRSLDALADMIELLLGDVCSCDDDHFDRPEIKKARGDPRTVRSAVDEVLVDRFSHTRVRSRPAERVE